MVLAAATVLAGCGSEAVSADAARRIVVAGLIDAGQPSDVAACTADAALERHAPDELVNESGTTSDEVNASIAAIVADCADSLAAPTVPPTTVATTTPATAPPSTTATYDSAVCTAGVSVLVLGQAADALDLAGEPGPAAFEGWIREALDRTELGVLTAPAGPLRDVNLEMHATAEELLDVSEASGFAIDDPAIVELGERLAQQAAELSGLLEVGCPGVDLADTDAAEALAEELLALDEAATATTVPTPTTVAEPELPDVDVSHAEAGIDVTVPAAWSGERGGTADTRFGPATRFLVRAADPAVFDEGRFDGTGVALYARDDTADASALLAASATAQSCRLVGEVPYDDGVYTGVRREYDECAGTPVAIVVVGAVDDDARVATYVEIRVESFGDRAVDLVLNSFYV